jgi:four helix bundle protein
VYRWLYKSALVIHKQILVNLPKEEIYILIDQLSRSSKSPPALIAEAYARRYSGKEWRKYIREAIGECNETIVHLCFVKDLYLKYINVDLCSKIIEEYEISGKQLYRLGESWRDLTTHIS